jgi:APA family basic amino acid/polyamine antiporter
MGGDQEVTAKPPAAAGQAPAERLPEEADSGRLLRGLGLTDCVLLVVGSMIGSGIFLTTGQVAKHLPHPWLILTAWLVGGALALTGALTYAELGAAIPRAGGHYVYLRKAYGPLVGFFDGWLSFLASFPGSIAFVALGLMGYLPSTWTGHHMWTVEILGLEWSVTSANLLAMGVIVALSTINALGLRMGSGTQNMLTGLKLAALVGIAGFGLLSARGSWGNLGLSGIGGTGSAGLVGFGAALIGISFAFLGWDATTYMAAEVRHPQRTIPRSLLLGTVLVLAVYLAFNVTLLYGLPTPSLAASQGPARDAVGVLLGSGVADLLGLAVIICILGSLNATVMVGPRIYYAMAVDGLFPRALGAVNHRTHVPMVAIAAQAALSCIIVLSATLGRILAFTVLVIWLLSAVTGAAVFVLRWREPELSRPYQVWGYPWVPGIFCLSSLALLANHLAHTPHDLIWLAGFLVAGLPLYALLRRRASRLDF